MCEFYQPSSRRLNENDKRLTSMVDRVGTSGFSWTAAGQLAGEDGPWDNDAVSYGYTHRLRTSLGMAQPNASAWSQGYSYVTV